MVSRSPIVRSVSGIAFVAYGLLYIAFHAVEARRFAAEYPSIPYDTRRRRRGVRFWAQEPLTAQEDAPTEPGASASG